jgi:hypothetical protein
MAFEVVREYIFRTVSQITLNYRGMPLSAGHETAEAPGRCGRLSAAIETTLRCRSLGRRGWHLRQPFPGLGDPEPVAPNQ